MVKTFKIISIVLGIIFSLGACQAKDVKLPLIFDTDTNNEVDDQFALGYLLFSSNSFDLIGITTNATRNGGAIEEHTKEAERVLRLCNSYEKIRLIPGADKSFTEIKHSVRKSNFDGDQAVNFIIKESKKAHHKNGMKLNILAVGKLSNLALAIEKDPTIIPNIKIVWLGSNYPERGEYNMDDDYPALQYLLGTDVELEVVAVRYNKPSGTDAVRVSRADIRNKMPGVGPHIKYKVEGRNGGEFDNFGDYAVNLFMNFHVQRPDSTRALYDMAAVAILKNPSWAEPRTIFGPSYSNESGWSEDKESSRNIVIWENFNRDMIIEDFYKTMKNYRLP